MSQRSSAHPTAPRASRAHYGGATGRGPASTRRSGTGGGTGGDITAKAMVLVFAAIVIAGVYYGFRYVQQREAINASISYVSHEVIDDGTLRVWSDVTRNRPDEAAYCIVQAYDYDKNEVGRREFAIAANGEAVSRIAVDIPTNARAVAGGAYGCSSDIPPYLDATNPVYANEP